MNDLSRPVSRETLLSWGFKKHKPSCVTHPNADAFYQLRIIEERTVLYFINAFEYDFSKIKNYTHDHKVKYTFEVTFYKPGGVSFEMTFHTQEHTTVEEALDFFRGAYDALGCIPDLYNN